MKKQAQPYIFNAKVLPNMSETLGELIQRKMKDVGISSKAELARRIGKSAAYVGDLINDKGKTKSGSYKPSDEVITKLCKALEVSEIDILKAVGSISDTGNMIPPQIQAIGFNGLDDDDLKDIAAYIEMRRKLKADKDKANEK